MAERTDLLEGTLDLRILKSLIFGPLHGWGISKWIRQISDDVLQGRRQLADERTEWRPFAVAIEQVLQAR